MTISDIHSIYDFNNFVESCDDSTLNSLAYECDCGLTTGSFPKDGNIYKIMDQINYPTLTSVEICTKVALEFMHRNVVPF